MTNADLAFTPAIELAEMVRLKKVSPTELVELYAARIEELDPTLNSYITTCLDRARDEAKEAEARIASNGNDLPPFHGVPISIKDLNDTAGVRTTLGCAAYADRIPESDEEVVRRIKDAGFIVLGKTNTPEFGTTPWTDPPAYGPSRNPWDTERTTGGSSGGAAGALAAGLCPVSQGSDGGGSIRIPASCCGLYGIKPSRGRVTHAPGPNSFLSQTGPISRTVADAAALIDVMEGYATGDAWYAPPHERPFAEEAGRPAGKLRVAWTTRAFTDTEIAPGNRAGAEAAAALLAELGHEVTEDSPPQWPQEVVGDFFLTWAVRTSAIDPVPPLDVLDPVNRALIELGQQTAASDYERGMRRIQRAARTLVAFFDAFDVLVTPTVAYAPPVIGSWTMEGNPLGEFIAAGNFVPFTPPWNTTGQPAASVPLHTDELGLPVGVQIVGRPGDEATLIRLSAQLEEARPWADRRPPVS